MEIKTNTLRGNVASSFGVDGRDGLTPYIKNGTWWIGNEDTGVNVSGIPGEQGIQGEKGEKGEQGAQGEQGIQGEKGDAGYTPQYGVDYMTDTDKEQIKQYIAEEISDSMSENAAVRNSNGSIEVPIPIADNEAVPYSMHKALNEKVDGLGGGSSGATLYRHTLHVWKEYYEFLEECGDKSFSCFAEYISSSATPLTYGEVCAIVGLNWSGICLAWDASDGEMLIRDITTSDEYGVTISGLTIQMLSNDAYEWWVGFHSVNFPTAYMYFEDTVTEV